MLPVVIVTYVCKTVFVSTAICRNDFLIFEKIWSIKLCNVSINNGNDNKGDGVWFVHKVNTPLMES